MIKVLETKRLVLRHTDTNDAEFILALLNTPGWLQYIGDRGIKTIDDAKNYIEKSCLHSYQTYGYGLYTMVLKSTQKAIGLCGLVNRPDILDHPDIGFAILPTYGGQGYTFEAATATMEYANTTLGIDTILGIVTENNDRSIRVLKGVGLHLKGKVNWSDGSELLLFSS